jgi:tetratricopeptide (TPR) repeat protein
MSRPLVGASLAAVVLLAAATVHAQSNLANCKYYTKTQQDFAQGLPYCEKCIEDEPDNPEARFFGAWCLAEVGRYEDAWPSFQWLIERANDKDKDLKKYAERANALVQNHFAKHFNKGVEYLKASDLQGARAEFVTATQANPTKAEGYLNLGYAENQLGNIDGALDAFRRAIQIAPDRKDSYTYYSVALGKKRDELLKADPPDSAQVAALNAELRTTLDKVVAADPSNHAALMQLGDLALSAGQDSVGITYIQKAIELSPDNVVQLYNIAVGFYERDDYGNAAKAFDIVVNHVADPADDLWRDAMYNRALALKAAGRFQEALACALKLIEVNDQQADYHSLASGIYIELKDAKNAELHYERAKMLKEQALSGKPEGGQ